MNTTAKGQAHGLDPINTRDREAWTLQAVKRAKQGDRHAVRYLYSRYSGEVRLYVASLLREADAVDDVVQTTFLKVLTKIGRYEAREAPFEAWLLRVARNTAFDELRRRRARASLPILEHEAVSERPPGAGALAAGLDGLPAAWRDVLVLRHLVGLSADEVAERLGTDRRSVATLEERACAALKAALRGPSAPVHGEASGRLQLSPREAGQVAGPLVEQLG